MRQSRAVILLAANFGKFAIRSLEFLNEMLGESGLSPADSRESFARTIIHFASLPYVITYKVLANRQPPDRMTETMDVLTEELADVLVNTLVLGLNVKKDREVVEVLNSEIGSILGQHMKAYGAIDVAGVPKVFAETVNNDFRKWFSGRSFEADLELRTRIPGSLEIYSIEMIASFIKAAEWFSDEYALAAMSDGELEDAVKSILGI